MAIRASIFMGVDTNNNGIGKVGFSTETVDSLVKGTLQHYEQDPTTVMGKWYPCWVQFNQVAAKGPVYYPKLETSDITLEAATEEDEIPF